MSQFPPDVVRSFRKWERDHVSFVHDTMRYERGDKSIGPLQLEPFQVDFMNESGRFRAVNKSRQIGYSFLFGVEALARAVMWPGHLSVFISKNLEEASAKINYVTKIVEMSPMLRRIAHFELLKKRVYVRLKGAKQWSEIRSMPCQAPRGATKADVYLDEFAHYKHAEAVYDGTLAVFTRAKAGQGQVTVASTPNGMSGRFWECTDGPLSGAYWQQRVPWWASKYMCKDVNRALLEAPRMNTHDRVATFGTESTIDAYNGSSLPIFQQEFELEFIDENVSFFPLDLIQPCMVDHLLCADMTEVISRRRGKLFAGFDVGRVRDNSELVVVDRFWDDDAEAYVYVPMLILSWAKANFDDQMQELKRLLGTRTGNGVAVFEKLFIDSTGMGGPIAEHLDRAHPGKVVAVNFTQASKEAMAVRTRRAFERGLIDLPDPAVQLNSTLNRQAKEFFDQIHSIKRKPAAGRYSGYEASSTTHHGDQFWALALAMCCAAEDLSAWKDSPQFSILG